MSLKTYTYGNICCKLITFILLLLLLWSISEIFEFSRVGKLLKHPQTVSEVISLLQIMNSSYILTLHTREPFRNQESLF